MSDIQSEDALTQKDNRVSTKKARRKRRIFFTLLACLMVGILAVVFFGKFLTENPFSLSYEWQKPSYVRAYGDTALVIDSSKTKISVVDKNNEVSAVIRGGSQDEKSFYYAQFVALQNNDIYVADVRYASSGTRVAMERVTKYSVTGKFLGELYSRTYEDGQMPKQYGNIAYLGVSQNEVYFLMKDNGAVELYTLNSNAFEKKRSVALGANIPVWNITYQKQEDSIYFTTKTGKLYAQKGSGTFAELAADNFGSGTILCDIDAAGDGVYCTDIGNRRLIDIKKGTGLLEPEEKSIEAPIYYRLAGSDTRLATTDNTDIVIADLNGKEQYRSAATPFTAMYTILRLIVWLLALLAALSAIMLIIMGIHKILTGNRSKVFKTSVLLAAVIIVSVAFISSSILSAMFKRLNDTTLADLTRTAQVTSDMSSGTFGDSLARIDSLDDYGNADYTTVRKYLDPLCDAAYANGSNMYYVLYKYDDQMLYGTVDYENTTGVVYPYMPFEGSGYDDVVKTGKIYSVASASDAYGSWTYAIAPIYSSEKKPVGVLEMGINLYAENMQNKNLISELAISTIVMILVILILLTEGTFLVECVQKKRKSVSFGNAAYLRPMAFLSFFAANLSAAFLPMLSEGLMRKSNLAISGSIGAALPLSAELLFIALLAFAGGFIINKAGMRKPLIVSIMVQAVGYLVTALAVYLNSYILLLFGRVLTGCGLGICIVAFNAMPDSATDESERNRLFTHLNAGLVSGVVAGSSLGAYIANFAGYAVLFIVSAAILVPVFILAIKSVMPGKPEIACPEDDLPVENGVNGLAHFVFNRRILAFLIMVMAPFLILLYFKDYMFPLYVSANGFSDVDIGNILLFSGAISIYLGPPVTEWLFNRIGDKGMIMLSGALYAAALILFGIFPGTGTATLAVFIISLVAAFGLTGQGMYFSSMPAFKHYGANRSMSVYSLWDNISQTAGPLLFGALLMLGYGNACLILGAFAAVMLVLFIPIGLRKGKEHV